MSVIATVPAIDPGFSPAKMPEERTVLYVGCGSPTVRAKTLHWSFRGWKVVYLDVDPATEPDVVASITDMRGVADGSVDAVFAAHVLEHVCSHEVPLALAEFLRVLKHDGDVLIQVPDLRQACEAVAEGRGEQPLYQSPAGPICAMDMLFGYRRYVELAPAMGHKTGFTEKSLALALARAGFVEVSAYVDQYDVFATGHKVVPL